MAWRSDRLGLSGSGSGLRAWGGLALAFHVHAKPRVKGKRSTTLPLELCDCRVSSACSEALLRLPGRQFTTAPKCPPNHLGDFSRCNSGSMGYRGYSYGPLIRASGCDIDLQPSNCVLDIFGGPYETVVSGPSFTV